MKHFIAIFIVLLPLYVLSQSKESNKYYQNGKELLEAKKYGEAVPYFQKSDSIDKASLKPNSKNYYRAELALTECNENLATQAYDGGRYDEALKLQTKVVDARKRISGDNNPKYARSLTKLALYYDYTGNYNEALRLETIAMNICKETVGDEHPDYAETLYYLAFFHDDLGNYNEAIRLGTIAMEIRRKALGEEHPDYATSLALLSVYYFRIANYSEAIRLGTIALEIRRKVLGENNAEYGKALSNMAVYYRMVGDYNEAIRMGLKEMEITRKTKGEQHPEYAISLSNLVSYYEKIGNYTEAIRLGMMAIEVRRKTLGEEHPDYAWALGNLAVLYHDIGNYNEAIRLGTIALEIRRKALGEQHPYYAVSISNLAFYNFRLGNYDEAIRLGTLAVEIRKNALGEDHHLYLNSLCELANYYEKKGNYDEALRLQTIATEKYKKVLGEEHSDYAISVSNLAAVYYDLGNYKEALRLGNIAMEVRKKVLGEEHPAYASSLSSLGHYSLVVGDYDKAADFYRRCYFCTNSFILKNFASMTTRDRANFWNKYSNFFIKDLTCAAYKISSAAPSQYDGDIIALAYNGQVFSKGLLLNAELEIQKIIEQSGDSTLAYRYYKLKTNRTQLDNVYATSLEERTVDADSLLKVIEAEDRQLVESCKELGDYTKNLSIDWHDVQKNLKDNDLAIEFAVFDDIDGKKFYAALVLKKGMKSPEFVRLFELDDFLKIKTSEYYTTPKLYDLVWKPLSKYLEGVTNVYFSPVGRFHTIGIEYLTDADGTFFAEKFDAYRLSSTRELALERTINPNRKAATYGGIKYDFSEDDWQDLKEQRDLKFKFDSVKIEFRDSPLISEVYRSGRGYLDGTKLESSTVANLLRSADYAVSAMSDVAATEESFKNLSGMSIKILHIGTHGFYESEEDLRNANLSFFTSSQQSSEDRSLSCSGLLFAGANSALDPHKRREIPEGVDDGVLTAKEISRLDFKGLDLVVLSACQTGLGEVTSEGVFGLQRGFKKAGAQTIVMSLWKVSDEATQLLMIEFFKNLTAGQSKRAAFLAAQDTVRAKFPSPLYWAAFIMVDGN